LNKNKQNIVINEIIYAKRKTIGIEITNGGKIIVKAPLYFSRKDIENFVYRHRRWIQKRFERIADLKKNYPRKFIPGEGFFYLGRKFELYSKNDQDAPLIFDNGFYIREGELCGAKELFIKWYKERAKEFVENSVLKFSKRCGVEYRSVKITSAESRWGSCSKKGNLNFSYRIAMLPTFAIDYVVVHELCHIIEFNHSKAFYGLVEKVLPDYRKSARYLKENGYLFRL